MKPRRAKTLVVNDEVSSGLRQTIELFANLGKQSGEVGKTLLFRFDHLSRGAGNKAFVAKFGFALGDFAFEAGDFLRETVALISTLSISLKSPTMATGAIEPSFAPFMSSTCSTASRRARD